MNEEEVLSAGGMPIAHPAYVAKLHPHFFNREFVTITYRTDPAALAKVVPAPLKPARDPLVNYEFIRMPDATGLGDYHESGQVIPVTFDGQPATYTHAMYVDDFAAIAQGRELMGYPKVLASPRVEVRRDCLVCTLDYYGVRVATATMTYKRRQVDDAIARRALETTGYLLKLIPDVDGSPRICELVKFRAGDVVVHGAWTGEATLELHPHVQAPVASLPVLEVVSATHVIADLSLGDAKIAYDYLRERAARQPARKAG
ncbi:MAG TPA: acetoacetate decarboxylase [Polyangiaceae bacterium]|nr:acetoacetate decarboxylase [Polyangiaceae bacterium]